jgi:hypothetical protein
MTLVAFGAYYLTTTIKAIGANVVAHVGFTRGGLSRQRNGGQEIV